MGTWMKRGFLLGSKNDPKPSRPLASKQDVDTSRVADPANKPRESLKIPLIPDYDDVPDKGRPFAGNILTIPSPTPLPSSGAEPHTLSLLYPGAKEAIEALPGFPTPYEPFLGVHYCIDNAPGAGKGMFALTDLNLGDLILRERPLCLFPRWFAHNNKDAEDFAMATLSLLKPKDYEDFFNLASSRPSENVAAGIVHTNSIEASRMPGNYNGNYASICRDLCRVNHSCVPNAAYRWKLKDLVYELRALRPIKKGEQIFISYIDNLQTSSARQEILRSLYNFTCRCPRCSLPPSEISASNNCRQILVMTLRTDRANDDSALSAWINDASLPDNHIIAKSMEIINAMYSEGLVDRDVCNAQYPRLVKAYCALKDAKNAKFWANRMALTLSTIYGDDHGWKKVADAPESTNWWGLRKKT